MKKIQIEENEHVGAVVPYVSDHGYKLVNVFILNWSQNTFRNVCLSADELDEDSKTLFNSAMVLNIEFRNTIQFTRNR
jgi:hypothetical protein